MGSSSSMDITPVVLRYDHFGVGLGCNREGRGGRERPGGGAKEDEFVCVGGSVLLIVYCMFQVQ